MRHARLLTGLEVFLAVGGLYGGIELLADPTGHAFGMPAEQLLRGTPFDNYLVPALVLFAVNGVFPLVAALAGALSMRWAKYAHVAVAVLLTGWMSVQLWLIGLTSPLQVFMLGLGVLMLILATEPWQGSAGKPLAHA